MRPSILLVSVTLAFSAQASWFSGSSDNDPAYSAWSTTELRRWLDDHKVSVPKNSKTETDLRELVAKNWNTASAWTYDQYTSAQKSFADVRETSFDKWDESRLREFLLEQGVVAPKGPREQLILLAKSRYRDYTNAASSFASRASNTASTAVYGDTKYQMSQSLSSVASQVTAAAAQTTHDAGRAFDDSKDYIYSSWDDSRLQKFLEDKGVIKTKSQKNRDELLALMHKSYGKVADPVWKAWSDSYIHDWLVTHNIIKSDYEKNRDQLRNNMEKYYYDTKDKVWSSWSDSQLKQWLVDRDIIKSDAQIRRDKMIKMVEANYTSAKDTFWSAWSDNQVKEWLIEHGYIRSDAQVKRDEMIKLAQDKYADASARGAAYLTWPDARLRAYLRENGISDDALPGTRPGLLQETRIRWVQTQTRAETLFNKISELVNSGVYKAEDALIKIFSLLTGSRWDETKDGATEWMEQKYEDVKEKVGAGSQKVKTEL